MIKITRTNILILLMLIGCLWLSCAADDPSVPSQQQLTFEKLVGSWTLGASGSVLLDGLDISLNYPGFSLSFADGTYQTTNAGDLLSASGTWEWVDQEAQHILLGSGETVTIEELTEVLFRFSFTHSGTGGTAAGLDGNYVITVNK